MTTHSLPRAARTFLPPLIHVGILALASAPAAAQTIDIELFGSGAYEAPPVASNGRLLGNVSLDVSTLMLTYDVSATGLVGSPTIAHIHVGAFGVSGGIDITLASVGGGTFQGTAGPLTSGQLDNLFTDNYYVNIHSSAFPLGEVRAQIFMPKNLHTPAASGAQETPPVPSGGSARGVYRYVASTRSIDYSVTSTGLVGTATVAHLHTAPPGVPGPITIPLTSVGGGAYAGNSGALTNADLLQIFSGGMYLNVHSTSFGGGEVRDQLEVGALNVTTEVLSVSRGGRQSWLLNAEVEHANSLFLLLGSFTGTSPGTNVNGVNVPLNLDTYTLFTLQSANQLPYQNTLGFLDANGEARAELDIPPASNPNLVGIPFVHAFAAIDPVTLDVEFGSNAVPLTFVP